MVEIEVASGYAVLEILGKRDVDGDFINAHGQAGDQAQGEEVREDGSPLQP